MNNAVKTILFSTIFVGFAFMFIDCQRRSEGAKEASLKITKTTVAEVETEPVPRKNNDDSADDPAIWINYKNPGQSLSQRAWIQGFLHFRETRWRRSLPRELAGESFCFFPGQPHGEQACLLF